MKYVKRKFPPAIIRKNEFKNEFKRESSVQFITDTVHVF